MLLTHAGKYFNLTTATSSGRCGLREGERESLCECVGIQECVWGGIAWGEIKTYPSAHAAASVHLVLLALIDLSFLHSPLSLSLSLFLRAKHTFHPHPSVFILFFTLLLHGLCLKRT